MQVKNQNVEKTDAELLILSIKNQLKSKERECKLYQEKFDENFLDAFIWQGKEMCIHKIWVQQLTWINMLLNDGVTIEEIFKNILNRYEQHLQDSNNVRRNSTCALSVELSIYKYQTFIEIRLYLLDLKKQYPKAF